MHDVAAPSPALKSILEATTEDGNALLSACNMGGQESGGRRVHLRVGQMDASVPPWQVLLLLLLEKSMMIFIRLMSGPKDGAGAAALRFQRHVRRSWRQGGFRAAKTAVHCVRWLVIAAFACKVCQADGGILTRDAGALVVG